MKLQHLLIILPLAVCVSCSEKSPSQPFQAASVPVRTAEVVVRDVPLYFEEMGLLLPYQTAEVKPLVSGQIKEMHFQEGEVVTEGELLYTLDSTPYAIRVQEAQALLAQDQANLNNVQKKLERFKSLSQHDLIAQVEWDELETRVALAAAALQADQARLAAAELDLARCQVRAPISGRTSKSVLQTGNMAVAGATLVTLANEQQFYVDFYLTELELQKLSSLNPEIAIYLPGTENCLAQGRLVFLDRTIDPKTGTVAARGLLTLTEKPLWAGQSVRVHLFYGQKAQAALIPLKAVRTNQLGPYVFSVNADQSVEMHAIKLGPEEKGWVVVEEGLNGATQIVTEGQSRLFPGSKVEQAAS